MFTGIIKEIGTIKSIEPKEDIKLVEIECAKTLKGLNTGDSVNVNGICSTITKITKKSFFVEYMEETLNLTTVKDWDVGYKVNLESSMSLSGKLDGHFVQGHIDDTGQIAAINRNVYSIQYPKRLSKFIAYKGSISVDGISLTISGVTEHQFTISLIPHTLSLSR